MKRSPLRRKPSARVLRFRDDLDAITPALVKRAGGKCELAGVGLCSGRPHRHHKLRRSQGGTNDLDNLLYVCDAHHEIIHRNPAWAYTHGYLTRSGQTN